ncbi:alpha/beta-hydrolase [Aspergillus karnatakaensis]|uniref:alpha/beta-hydrolase n=1 Tax=Aspergillus karnatakaensis TaxID=1810916 RepID=UPI003CCD05BD
MEEETSTFSFKVTKYLIDGQYIREYPNATVTPEAQPKLAVKEYTPINNPTPRPGDVTIVAAHGCGFPKELYEPLWEDLLTQSEDNGFHIRAIWIADTAGLGESGMHNEQLLGDSPSWFDHSRDLLYMINQFRDEMPQPIIGVGHSMGAGQLVLLSLMHPRLFTSLSLIEPVIAKDIFTAQGPQLSLLSLKRRDTWPSKAEAIAHARKICKRWDPRVLERWIEHGYRTLPPGTNSTAQATSIGSSDSSRVTLKSSKHQEVMHYLRPNPSGHRPLQLNREGNINPGPVTIRSQQQQKHDPLFYPDIVGPAHTVAPFYRSEPVIAWRMLPHLRPSTLYIFGSKSPISTPVVRTQLLERTGTGVGGSGGKDNGRVRDVVFDGAGHQLPLENTERAAGALGEWVGLSVKQWKADQQRIMARAAAKLERNVGDWVPLLEGVLRDTVGGKPQRKANL